MPKSPDIPYDSQYKYDKPLKTFLFLSWEEKNLLQEAMNQLLQHLLIDFFFKGLLDFFLNCHPNLRKREDPTYHWCKRHLLLVYLCKKRFLHASPLMHTLL